MGVTSGPSKSHSSFANYVNVDSSTPLGSCVGGGRLFCKSGNGIAYIVAPSTTEVSAPWASGAYSLDGNKCCISDWSALNTKLISCGFTPSQWFVPSCSQLYSGWQCRSNWDGYCGSGCYWTSTESNTYNARLLFFNSGYICTYAGKTSSKYVRAFRCVTY
jgi:hypothetical protein